MITLADTSNCTDCHSHSEHSMWNDYAQLFNNVFIDSIVHDISSYFNQFEYHPWIFSLIGSSLVGLSGILPLLVIPIEEGISLKSGGGSARTLKILLSFAVGCLLGDVFLHVLPEVWLTGLKTDVFGAQTKPLAQQESEFLSNKGDGSHPDMMKGLLILAGLLVFFVLEKLFTFLPDDYEPNVVEKPNVTHKLVTCSGTSCLLEECGQNDLLDLENLDKLEVFQIKEKEKKLRSKCAKYVNGYCKNIRKGQKGGCEVQVVEESTKAESSSIHISGYLNLMANVFDNFTHGLAVGGSFLVSFPHGVLTTVAILLHEIPHEVGDFAILLRSGFSRWDAARAQLYTASAGTVGALTAVMTSGASGTVEARTSWILPFTAGGFLHIALVTVLPDVLKEENPRESLIQLFALLSGIAIMASLNYFIDE